MNDEEDNELVVIAAFVTKKNTLHFLDERRKYSALDATSNGFATLFRRYEDMVAIALYCLVLYIICSKRTSEIEI